MSFTQCLILIPAKPLKMFFYHFWNKKEDTRKQFLASKTILLFINKAHPPVSRPSLQCRENWISQKSSAISSFNLLSRSFLPSLSGCRTSYLKNIKKNMSSNSFNLRRWSHSGSRKPNFQLHDFYTNVEKAEFHKKFNNI